MRGKGQDGAITVFLSIILLIMITLAGVIVDAARINIAGPQIQRAVETSVRSSLAGYYMPLKEQYGLFALNENDEEMLKETIVEYINKNLMIDEESLDEEEYLDLYDYEIESISVEPIFDLTENPVTRQQILEYMKYRAPKEFVEGFIKKLEMFKKAGATSEVYKRKVELEKEMKKVENIQREIYKKIYGKHETYRVLIWSFEKSDKYFVRKLDEDEYSSLIDAYVDLIYNYKRQNKKLSVIKEKLSDADTDKKKKSLLRAKSRIENKIEETERDMGKKFDEFKYNIKKYSDVNQKAKDKIEELKEKSVYVQNELEGFSKDLETDKDNIIEESFNQLSAETEHHKDLLFNVENGSEVGLKSNDFENIKKDLEDNKKYLSRVSKLIEVIDPTKAKKFAKEDLEEEKIHKVESTTKDIMDKLKKYNNDIEYNYKIEKKDEEEKYKDFDVREDSQNEANEKIEIKGNVIFKSVEDINDKDYKSLPSTVKLQRDKENKARSLGFLWRKNTDEESNGNNKQPKDEKIEEVEFYKQESFGFGESALSYLGDITENLNPKNIRDEIYINEYIMGMFKNYVSEVDVEEKYNLRHQEKLSQVSFFEKSEVEYILNGSRSEKINQTLMDSKILVTRFALNSIHAFLCPEKNKTAGTTATVVAGVFTGGAGIPIIKTLIILGWSMAEATYDLQELKSGREIVLYKTENDWVTDLKGGKKESSKELDNIDLSKGTNEKSSSKGKNPMDTSYQDYLRFFLLVQKDDVTMTRLQDLIQLNMRKSTGNEELRLDELNTYVKVDAVVSIKYLFLTQSFIPEEFKTKNNRHKFKVEIYQGY